MALGDVLSDIGLNLDPRSYNRPYAPGPAVLVGTALNSFAANRERAKQHKVEAAKNALEAKLGVNLDYLHGLPWEIQKPIWEKAGFGDKAPADQPIPWLGPGITANTLKTQGLPGKPEVPAVFGPMPEGSLLHPTAGSPATPPVAPGLTGKEAQNALLANMGIPAPATGRAYAAQPWYNEPSVAKTPGAIAARAKAEQLSTADESPAMDEPTLRMTALMYAKTGQLPPMGMGKTGAVLRTKILTYAANNFPHLDVATNKADYAKNQKSLSNLQGNYDQTKAFGDTFEKNAQPLEAMVNSIPNLGTRFGNHVGRWLASQAGSPEVAQFHSQMSVVRPEAQRILQFAGTGGNMALTDHQERGMRAMLSDDFTPAQLRSSLAVLRQDRANKLSSYSDQIDAIRARIAWNESGANPNVNVGGQQNQGGAGQQNQGGDVNWTFDANGNLTPAGQ